MTKITKKQYNYRKQTLLKNIEQLEKSLSNIPLEIDGLPQNIINQIADIWNCTHDAIEDTKKELKFLDDEYSRRNWSSQEYYQHSLITSNID